MKRIDIDIDHVVFEHSCVGLARQLADFSGVAGVDIDWNRRYASITYDDTRLSVADIRRVVDGCGYGYGSCSVPVEVDDAERS
jgi:hypothetical protein